MEDLVHKELTDRIIGAAIRVHRAFGPGLLESAYEMCLFDALQRSGLAVARQVEVPVEFEGHRLDCGYRIDILVADAVVVEVKAIDVLTGIHSAQLLTYMRLARKPVGLLINFNVKVLKDEIVRRVLDQSPLPSSAVSACSAVNPISSE